MPNARDVDRFWTAGAGGHARAAEATADAVPAIAAALAGYLLVQAGCLLAPSGWPLLPGGTDLGTGWFLWSTVAGAVVVGVVAWLVRQRPVSGSSALAVAALVLLLVGAHASAGLVLADQSWRTGDIMLALAATGWLLTPWRWWAPVVYLLWGGWLAGVVGAGTLAPGAVAGLAVATAASLAVRQRRLHELDDLRHIEQLVQAASVHDPLTGLVNRRGLSMLAAPIVEACRRQGDAVHATMLAVEGLAAAPADPTNPTSPANTTSPTTPISPREPTLDHSGTTPASHLGPTVADRSLVEVATALAASVRGTDVPAVWQPGVFVVVGPGPGVEPDRLAARVIDRLARDDGAGQSASAGAEQQVSLVAVSAVLAPWDPGDVGTLLHAAERDLAVLQALRRAAASRSHRAAG